MLIESEFDIQFQLPAPVAMVAVLHLYPSLDAQVRSGDQLLVEMTSGYADQPNTVIPTTDYIDSFGNRCSRFSRQPVT